MNCLDKFWLDDITQLLCTSSIIPIEGEPLAISLNKITRIVIILGIGISFFNLTLGLSVIIICVIIISALYYSNKKVEPFCEIFPSKFNDTKSRFCNDCIPITPNDLDYVSQNYKLVGGSNLKTRISPIIAPHSHDLSAWAVNDLVTHSAINAGTNFDAYKSGYSTEKIGKCKECYYSPCMCNKTNDIISQTLNRREETRLGPHISDRLGSDTYIKNRSDENINNRGNIQVGTYGRPPEDSSMPCMINTNIMTGVDDIYKDNILTQTLQPGVYQKSKVGEPINSMIGISYQQQFMPTEVTEGNNFIKYTQQNSHTLPTNTNTDIIDTSRDQTYSNIYDPRFSGYGDSQRTFIDRVTGQPRFFYDDINAIKMPNYITRNNVDIFPWATTYGPDKPLENNNCEIRQLANNAFHDSALIFRTEMQERLMRKRNAELWQERAFPKSTLSKTGLGFKSCL